VAEIEKAGGRAQFAAADLSDPGEARRLAAEAGEVDILVNNAGVYRFGATADADDELFDAHFDTNVRAPRSCWFRRWPRAWRRAAAGRSST
jgi:NAD(P)-dependent dehydrogenase (short-subunit alcohol dehydrogenase family)